MGNGSYLLGSNGCPELRFDFFNTFYPNMGASATGLTNGFGHL